MTVNTFNNKVVLLLTNVCSNKIRIKNRSTGKGTVRTSCIRNTKESRGRGSKKLQSRNSICKEFRGMSKICTEIYFQSKQCSCKITKAGNRVRDLLLSYIFYNPSFWTLMFIIDTSFSDDILNQVMQNQYVIIDTTQCLLYRMCNT